MKIKLKNIRLVQLNIDLNYQIFKLKTKKYEKGSYQFLFHQQVQQGHKEDFYYSLLKRN